MSGGKIMKWVRQFLVIAAVTFLGEMLRYWIPLAVPAGIYGLLLLFLCLCTGILKLPQVEGAADFLIETMPFYFIPAGVGLMTKWGEITSLFAPIAVAVFFITAIVMAVTGTVSQRLLRKGKRGEKDD